MSIVIGLILAAAVVVLVAWPFLREPVAENDTIVAQPDERLALIEARDRALAALKELEFDHRTGKIDDDDYRELIGPLRREAASALRAIDRQGRYGAAMTEPIEPVEPVEPAPPPDEGTPPTPAPVPEPYPPPDEATIPSAQE